MTVRRSKISSSFSFSRLADSKLDEMVDKKIFASRSNAIETSVVLLWTVLNANTILPAAEQMGIRPLPVGGSV
jgi:Arc/MetJ-type ribon-helix-helix transcriptional regulator